MTANPKALARCKKEAKGLIQNSELSAYNRKALQGVLDIPDSNVDEAKVDAAKATIAVAKAQLKNG